MTPPLFSQSSPKLSRKRQSLGGGGGGGWVGGLGRGAGPVRLHAERSKEPHAPELTYIAGICICNAESKQSAMFDSWCWAHKNAVKKYRALRAFHPPPQCSEEVCSTHNLQHKGQRLSVMPQSCPLGRRNSELHSRPA